MLVLASQIVEKEQETQMDIDPETLRKFTKDDDKVDSWTASTSKFIPMTQTVFRGKTKQNFGGQSSNNNKLGPIVEETPVDTNKILEENQKLKNEIKLLAQRQQARAGEVTFLRNQMQKKSSELEKARQEKIKLQKEQKEALGKANEEKKLAVDIIEGEKKFMELDLKRVTEQFQDLQKRISTSCSNGPNSNINRFVNTSHNGDGPPAKRTKLQSDMMKPSNLDKSIFEQPQTTVLNVPPVTKEAVVQTFARSNRGFVLNRIDEGVDSTSINVTSEGSIHIASHLLSLSTLLSEVTKLICTPEESRQDETAWIKSAILIHHTPISTTEDTDDDYSSKEYSMVYDIINAIGTAIKNGNDISPMKLLVNISCQDTLVDLINVSQVEEICAEILKRERDPEEDISHEKATTGVNLLCNILEILIFGPGIFRKSYCHNNQGSCMMSLLWRAIDQIEFEKASVTSISLLGSLLPRWISIRNPRTFAKCSWCYSDMFKMCIKILWAITTCFINDNQDPPSPEFPRSIRNCCKVLHQIWLLDQECLYKLLPESPEIQRRFLISTRQIKRSFEKLDFTPLEIKRFHDLKVNLEA